MGLIQRQFGDVCCLPQLTNTRARLPVARIPIFCRIQGENADDELGRQEEELTMNAQTQVKIDLPSRLEDHFETDEYEVRAKEDSNEALASKGLSRTSSVV